MSYTPVELRHVRVSRRPLGYDRATVEQILAQSSNVPVFPEISGGHSRKLHCRPVPASA